MSASALKRWGTSAAGISEVAGFVAMVRLGDGGVLSFAEGMRSVAAPAAMTADTVFWIASLTKLATSLVALQLIEDGRLSLDQPVASVRPDFADLPVLTGFDSDGAPRLEPATDSPTIRHLMTHTSGLGYAFTDPALARFAASGTIGAADHGRLLPRRFAAGSNWLYGASTDWLGAVIERICGEGLDEVFRKRITGPLGMDDTTCVRSPEQLARAAVVHARLADGSLAPTGFAMPPPPHFNIGGGALYSTAPDFMRLMSAVLDGEILSDASRAALFENQVGDLEAGALVSADPNLTRDYDPLPGATRRWSLGLMINPEPIPDGRSAGSGGWAGLANCYYWIDPAAGVAGVLMSQILPFADPTVLKLFASFERAAYAA